MTAASKVHYDAGDRPRCGHPRPWQLTADREQVTCVMCADLLDGISTVQLIRPSGYRRADVRPCGTHAAHRRHQRRGERIDETCRQAETRRRAAMWAASKQKGLAA